MYIWKEEQAVDTLLKLIEEQPDEAAAYGQLIKIYEKQEAPDKIRDLLMGCDEEDVKIDMQLYCPRSGVQSSGG